MHKIFIALVFFLTGQIANAEKISCNSNQSSYQCLLCNCIGESIGELMDGKIAVAKTVVSRSVTEPFPNTLCGVIYQPSQFSWAPKNGKTRVFDIKDVKALQECRDASDKAINEGPNGLLYFYNPRVVTPKWLSRTTSCGRLGDHVFLVARGKTCPKRLGANAPAAIQQRKSNNGGGVR